MLILEKFKLLLFTVSFTDLIDIVLVAILFKVLYSTIKNTRAMQLLKGMLLLAVLAPICKEFSLNTMYWVLSKSITILLLAMPVIFQPELRSALEKLGKKFPGSEHFESSRQAEEFIEEIVAAVADLAPEKIGALIIIQRETGLADIFDRGIKINGIVTKELIKNIFFKNAPLHDGAVVIRGNIVLAAGCYLPLSQRRLSSDLGTRHRAAIGITEETDAIAIVVSEENGKISLVEDGRLLRGVSVDELRKFLTSSLIIKARGLSGFIKRRQRKNEK
ncbi:MAG: diadenylate cyclase CdaA [Negativicutes bacterium]